MVRIILNRLDTQMFPIDENSEVCYWSKKELEKSR